MGSVVLSEEDGDNIFTSGNREGRHTSLLPGDQRMQRELQRNGEVDVLGLYALEREAGSTTGVPSPYSYAFTPSRAGECLKGMKGEGEGGRGSG